MKDKEHVLLLVIGRSASGKDTLVNKLTERIGVKQLISYTTRERRQGEGDTHRFVTEVDYKEMLDNNQVAVDTSIAGNYYWSTIEQLYEADVYVCDYIGFKKLRELDLPNLRLVSVFINTPDAIREERALNKRGDDRAKWRVRNYAEAPQFREMLKNADFDYAVSNIAWPKAYSVLRWIATVEGVYKHQEEINNAENSN